MHHPGGRGVELVQALAEDPQRDQAGALDVRNRPLVRLADVQDAQVLARLEAALELDARDLVHWLRRLPTAGAAEGRVVLQLADRRRRPAQRAGRVPVQLHLVEAHGQGVVEEQPADERLADAEQDLQRLGRLDGADDAGQDPEDTALGAARHGSGWGRLGVEAAIARAALRPEDARLALEAEDRAVDVRLAEEVAGVVRQVARLEVVRAVDDHVVAAQDVERVLAAERRRVRLDRDVRVQRAQAARRAVELRPADEARVVQDLPLQVALLHHVELDDPDAAHPGGREVQGGRRAEPARAHEQHARGLEPALAFDRHLRQHEVARVARSLLRRQVLQPILRASVTARSLPQRTRFAVWRRERQNARSEGRMRQHRSNEHTPGKTPPRGRRLALAALALGCSAALASARAPVAAQEKAPYQDAARPAEERIDDLLGRLTLEEKVALVHGNGKFRSGGVERLGLPLPVDGRRPARHPRGGRARLLGARGLDERLRDRDAHRHRARRRPGARARGGLRPRARRGSAGAREARGARPRRSTSCARRSCGRNYDYFGEDPWLAGRITVGYVRGMQAEQTVASLKHFALNNQETDRGSIDVQVDERALREIYLPAFEAGVKEGGALSRDGRLQQGARPARRPPRVPAQPGAEARVGLQGRGHLRLGQHARHATRPRSTASTSRWARADPTTSTSWRARSSPGSSSGRYPVSLLDDKVRRNLRMLFAAGAVDGRRPGTINTPEHLAVARRVAQEGMVLLKNDAAVLPLDLARLKTIAVIGDNAVRRFAAGGNAAGVKAFREIDRARGHPGARRRQGRRRLLPGLPPAGTALRRPARRRPACARAS